MVKARVSTYTLCAGNGKKIRKATKVQIGSRTVRFIERMPKKQAIKQARKLLRKGYP